MGATGVVSYIVYGALLKRALQKQQEDLWNEFEQLMQMQAEELTRRSQERFSTLIAEFNHKPPVPTGSRIVGLNSLISLVIKAITTALYEQQKELGYNNDHIILMLARMSEQEIWFLDQSIKEWLDSRREILTKYNADQGL